MAKNSLIFILVLVVVAGAAVFSVHYVRAQQAGSDVLTATVKIGVCGDGVAEGDEECDTNDDLKGQTCIGLGYDGGTLRCLACTFDISGCTIEPAGGGGFSRPRVIFRGKAYPSAKITILKDGQVADLITADPQANFRARITNLTTGTYTFGLWAEDNKRRRSITITFTKSVTSGETTTISGIFLPPTIELEKISLGRGEFLNVLGQTAPKSELTISIDLDEQEMIGKTKAESDGTWSYSFNTSVLEEGSHIIKVRAALEGLESSYSKVLSFYIEEVVPFVVCPNADLNKDGRVNLVDFSILLYYWGKDNACCDQNQDRVVGLQDFSIMMYYWTG